MVFEFFAPANKPQNDIKRTRVLFSFFSEGLNRSFHSFFVAFKPKTIESFRYFKSQICGVKINGKFPVAEELNEDAVDCASRTSVIVGKTAFVLLICYCVGGERVDVYLAVFRKIWHEQESLNGIPHPALNSFN